VQLASSVYRKTSAAHSALQTRDVLLSAAMRRLLVMIDGKQTLQSLARYVRAKELAPLIDQLRTLRLIEPANSNSVFSHTTLDDVIQIEEALSSEQLLAARRAAMEAAQELLGPLANDYLLEIAYAESTAALRVVVGEIEARITTIKGDDMATMFIELIRDAVAARVCET
jgi:hypothetical protein